MEEPKRLNELEIKQLWEGLYTKPAGLKWKSTDHAIRYLWNKHQQNTPELLEYFKEFTFLESSKIREFLIQLQNANPGTKVHDIKHNDLITLETIQGVIDSIEKEEEQINLNNKNALNTTTMDLCFFELDKILAGLKIIDPLDFEGAIKYLVESKRDFSRRFKGGNANKVLDSLNDEIEIIKIQITKNSNNSNFFAKSDFSLELSALNRFINEIQTIEIKVIEYDFRRLEDRLHFNIPSDHNLPNPILIAYDVSHYHHKKSDYRSKITRFQQEAFTEISLLTSEQNKNLLKRLDQIEKRFSDAWKLYGELFSSFKSNKLTSIDLDIKLPALFIIPKHKEGKITHEFMLDLQDTLMFKNGSLSGLISQMKKLIGIPENDIQNMSKDVNAYSYIKYRYNLSVLSTLLNHFQENGYISNETSLSDFRKIFNNTQPDKPIIWLKGIESLAYFVKLLHVDFKLIKPIKSIWKVTAKLFTDENNQYFDSKNFKGQKVPSKAVFLENSVDLIK